MSQRSADGQSTTTYRHEDGEEPRSYPLSRTPSRSPQKSRANLRRNRSDVGGVQDELARAVDAQVKPIVAPVVGLDDLRDGYYRDLRALLPPPAPDAQPAAGAAVVVDAKLRETLDAVDEIDRALSPLLMLLRLDRTDRRPQENLRRLPLRGRLRRPDDDAARVQMKTYRVRAGDDDWTAVELNADAAVELNAEDDGSSETSCGPHTDVDPSDPGDGRQPLE